MVLSTWAHFTLQRPKSEQQKWSWSSRMKLEVMTGRKKQVLFH